MNPFVILALVFWLDAIAVFLIALHRLSTERDRQDDQAPHATPTKETVS